MSLDSSNYVDLDQLLCIRRTSPEPHLWPYSSTKTIAPRDVFWDYDCVISVLESEQTGTHYEDTLMTDTSTYCESLPGSCSDTVRDPGSDDSFGSDGDDYEYRGSAVRVGVRSHQLSSLSAVRRKNRRMQPYRMQHRRGFRISVDFTEPSDTCPYIDPKTNERCTQTTKDGAVIDWTKQRHWRTVHLFKEAKEMREGTLEVGQGTIIRSERQLDKTLLKVPQCPCCGLVIARSDAMARHIKQVHQ